MAHDTGDRADDFDAEKLRRKYLEERDKRLRPEGEKQYLDATGEFEEFVDDPYIDEPLKRDPITEEVDVAIIGGGFGGLLTAAGLRKEGIGNFRIIEQGGDFGGTWYWNRYPGVRCDIESLVYMPLLEEVGTVPKLHYATGGEIFDHCKAIGRHFDLYDRALFQTKATRFEWDESRLRWKVSTDRGDCLYARFVTVSQGPLAKVKLPGIPGIKDFKGKMFHSSRWDYDYTGGNADGGLTGLATERVGVIGTGATAVQIIPQLAEYAKELVVFQRTPSAIDRRDNKPVDPDWYASLPKGWQRERMDNFLSILDRRPQKVDMVADQWTDFWKRMGARMAANQASGGKDDPHTIMQSVDYEKMNELRDRVSQTIKDPRTAQAATPWYNYLCKRPLYSDDFLEAFNLPNVTLVDTDGQGVERITETGVVANGKEYELDCIIFATGFDVGAAAHKVGGYELIGCGGQSLDEKWADGMRSVHGTQMHGFPNFHIVGGVAQGTTAFNFTHTLLMQADHAVGLIARCVEDGIARMEVTEEAEDRWLAAMEAHHRPEIQQFYEECTPGFLNNEGNVSDKPSFIGSTYGAGPFEYNAVITAWRENGFRDDTDIVYESDEALAEKAS